MKHTVVKVVRNLVASVMKQKSKKIAHKNDRRNKDAKKHWKHEEW
jgi:hypothetical protein